MVNEKLQVIQNQIISEYSEDISINLATGQMGLCIYSYIVGRYNKGLLKIANKMMDCIFNKVNDLESINIKDGLSGIGLGINYLIRNGFIKGDSNKILSDIDDEIFKKIVDAKAFALLSDFEIIQLLYYLYIRLYPQSLKPDADYLLKELAIYLINKLYERIDLHFMEEPFYYNIGYKLPQSLYILGKFYSLGFYDTRIKKIIDELEHSIVSTIPNLHANRLFLLWGMNALGDSLLDKRLKQHMFLLEREINIDILLEGEFKNKSIFIYDGLSSIYGLITSTQNAFTQDKVIIYKQKIIESINESKIWDLLFDVSYFKQHRGLLNGFTGVHLTLMD